MTNLVTVDCDCSCEKEKSLVRSFLSSVVCSSQSVDCSIQWHSVVVVGSGAPSFLCVGLYMPHSQMGQYLLSYLLTLEVDLIEFLEIMAQIWQYVIVLSLKPIKVTSDFILN